MKGFKKIYCSVFFILLVVTGYGQKETSYFQENFKDSTDNAFDISKWLSKVYGFFPLVSVVTEPAVGYGVSGGLIFIHQSMEESQKEGRPPSMSALGGLYTENGTYGLGLFHKGYAKGDKYRYTTIGAYTNANLSVYRNVPLIGNKEFKFNLEGVFFQGDFLFRLGKSRSFLGTQYVLTKFNVGFTTRVDESDDLTQNVNINLSGLGGMYDFDTRDNVFTPNKGMFFTSKFIVYNEAIGSNFDYTRFDNSLLLFTNKLSSIILGLRTQYQVMLGDGPFIANPFVGLRGIPVLRYQGKHVVLVETEERWDFAKRWSMVGFGGVGKAFNDNVADDELAYSLGAGGRYLLARSFGLYTGIDVARGPEDWAFYIQFGHYWNRL